MTIDFELTEAFALEMDQKDPLARFRDRFHIPENTIYMDGNSLGLLSKDGETACHGILEEWKALAIRGWLEAGMPWFSLAEKIGAMAATLVGAEDDEVVLTGTTTVNIHSLLAAFYRPEGKRTKILADELTFPSDIYAMDGQVRLRGLDPKTHLMLVKSRDGRTLSEKDIIRSMSDDVALAFLPSVLYRSGQLLDMPLLAAEARRRGIVVGFDFCHSAGAIPHQLDAWGADFAVWCSYKYLNGGPGAPAFLYVNRRHFGLRPLLSGWFGFVKARQFDLVTEFDPERSAGGFQISSPGILGAAPVLGSLGVTLEAGIDRLRDKSLALTSYLMRLVDGLLSAPPYDFRVGTPREPDRRGGHVAVERDAEAFRICQALRRRGVVPDFRPPDIIRIAPVALYNSFHEVWQVARHMKEIIDRREYETLIPERSDVT